MHYKECRVGTSRFLLFPFLFSFILLFLSCSSDKENGPDCIGCEEKKDSVDIAEGDSSSIYSKEDTLEEELQESYNTSKGDSLDKAAKKEFMALKKEKAKTSNLQSKSCDDILQEYKEFLKGAADVPASEFKKTLKEFIQDPFFIDCEANEASFRLEKQNIEEQYL